jgi:hypothetical protein
MKLSVFLVGMVILAILSCNKDKFTTEPQVKVKSISPSTVFRGDIIELKGKFTDDEGDIDSIYIVYKWYNNTTVTRHDTDRYNAATLNLPAKIREGDILVQYAYGQNIPPNRTLGGTPVAKDTTATFGLILIDKAGHRSGYSESDKIRLKKN